MYIVLVFHVRLVYRNVLTRSKCYFTLQRKKIGKINTKWICKLQQISKPNGRLTSTEVENCLRGRIQLWPKCLCVCLFCFFANNSSMYNLQTGLRCTLQIVEYSILHLRYYCHSIFYKSISKEQKNFFYQYFTLLLSIYWNYSVLYSCKLHCFDNAVFVKIYTL